MDSGGEDKSSEELWREVAELKSRVQALEAASRLRQPTPIARTETMGPAKAAPVLPPIAPIARPTLHADEEHQGRASALETRIGAQLFNRVGIFAVLAAAAWFLKLAIDRAWIGPGLRVIVGLLVAAGLVVWSERFLRRGVKAFSYTLKALASGIAYLSLWACFNLYHLAPSWVVFAGMVAVTLMNALLAWRQESELLAALALAGGLATPALLSTGGDHELFLFSYLLLLDIGAVTLAVIRPWPRMVFGAFAGTTFYLGFWLVQYESAETLALTLAFLATFFGLFTATPLLTLRKAMSGPSPAAQWMVGLPVAVGLCGFLEAYSLLSSTGDSAQGYWIALVLGLAYLALIVFAAFSDGEQRRFFGNLRAVHLGLAVGFTALVGFLKFHGYGIPLWWIAELAILATASYRLRHGALVRALRGNCAALLATSFGALFLLPAYDRQSDVGAFFNSHFATYLAGLTVFAAVTALSRRLSRAELKETTSPEGVDFTRWEFLAGFAIIAFNLIALMAVSLQIELYWREQLPWSGRGFKSLAHPAYVDLTYSAWFMLYGGALMAAGFLRRSAFLRWQALILLALSIGKVFLFDTSHLTEGYRVASFLGLGVLLLAVSFVYQRDLLALRTNRQDGLS